MLLWTTPSLLQGYVVPAVITTMSRSDFWWWHSHPYRMVTLSGTKTTSRSPVIHSITFHTCHPCYTGKSLSSHSTSPRAKVGHSGALSLQRVCENPVHRLSIPVFAIFEKARHFQTIRQYGWVPLRCYTWVHSRYGLYVCVDALDAPLSGGFVAGSHPPTPLPSLPGRQALTRTGLSPASISNYHGTLKFRLHK